MAGTATDIPVLISVEIASELSDRLAFAFAQENIVESIRRALRIGSAMDSQGVWRAFVSKIVRELHAIEREVTDRHCRVCCVSKGSKFGRVPL